MLTSFNLDLITNILSWVWVAICLILFIYYQFNKKFSQSQYFLKGVTNRIYLALFICIGFAFQRDYILAVIWFVVALSCIRSKRLFLSNYIIGEVDRIGSELLKIDGIVGALDEKLKISQGKILYIEKRLGSKDRIMEIREGSRDIIDSMEIRKEWVSDLLNLIQDRFDSAQTMGEIYLITEMSEFLINEVQSDLKVKDKDKLDNSVGGKDGKEREETKKT